MTGTLHVPVMLETVLQMLAPRAGGVFLDATVGLGGHAEAILGFPGTQVVGLDVDPAALEHCRRRLAPFGTRAALVEASYAQLERVLAELRIGPLAGVLFDLGVSSLQLDTPERGFSFRHDAPLDMRFSPTGPTAAQWLAEVAEEDLVSVLRELGEEPRARRVARALVRAREREPLSTTGQVRRIVAAALGHPHGRIDPATRTFQAIRMAVNRELEGLPAALEAAARRLAPGARLVVIAFHSLEDRISKRTFRHLSGRCVCPPGTPECACRPESLLEPLTRRPLQPSEAEVAANPRARSARLRAAQRRAP
ncbi:MAG TPA: 16S rRNA (cytosine(1402)-N(4))-methyltransferase RsmH [Thermoanaerobaculaceae bacterium]|nr:16S rRNA (cytosine(1402)-N(4))-methyltransferase RsmH [Thermoanaerobaculaceae bacterium]HRS16351.1 16S rRNA (cytosine(1402)-N(4))-methyltransferase RsmH [Thermoanaerobaculaceae bacterium]